MSRCIARRLAIWRIRGVREVGGDEGLSFCTEFGRRLGGAGWIFVMVERECCGPLCTGVRVPLSGDLWAVVVRFTNFDVGTSSVRKSGSDPTILMVDGRFTVVY